MFDHYFLKDKEGNIAPKEFHGANKVVDKSGLPTFAIFLKNCFLTLMQKVQKHLARV